MPNSLRAFFEPRFGRDLSDVRIHAGSTASESAKAVDARAYTIGRDVVFGEGQYSPDTHSGKRLIAHELTHVVQQSGASQAPAHATLQREPRRPDPCVTTPANELSPRDWVKCAYARSINPDAANPLRFTFTGVVATGDVLAKWMSREGVTLKVAMARIRSSHEFSGTTEAQETAIQALKAKIPMEKLSVCIRPVQIADDNGKNPTALPSFDAAQAIWGKCCIDVTVKGGKTISKTAFKTLEHSGTDTGAPTAEEAKLFAAAGSGGGCISVFVAETFQDGGKTSKDISGGAGARFSGSELVVVAVEGVHPTIVAHELGHAMWYLDHEPPRTVMDVIASKHDQTESDLVSWVICEEVRNFAKSSGGKKDCTADTIENLPR